ncbi:MAG: PsbP-related protein [Methanobacterium sp.]
MKRYIIFVIVIISLVIFASGCTDNVNKDSNELDINNSINQNYNHSKISTKTYSSPNGISFNYPKGWQRSDWSDVEYGIIPAADVNMQLSFADPKSAEKYDGYNNYFYTVVTIEKAQLPFGFSIKSAYDNKFAEVTPGFAFESMLDTTATVDGEKAYVKTYTVVEDGVQRKVKEVWFEKNGFAYVILIITLPKDFDGQQANFDVILNSFKIQ